MNNDKISILDEQPTIQNNDISRDRQLLLSKNEENERRIFTDKEAANYLRISQITLWRERKKGKISFHRAASKIIYTRDDLEKYLERSKRNAFATSGGQDEK